MNICTHTLYKIMQIHTHGCKHIAPKLLHPSGTNFSSQVTLIRLSQTTEASFSGEHEAM